VGRVLDILTAELDRTLAFLGCTSVAELDASRVRVSRAGQSSETS
jgi:isopentenyl diphosphate isomerase/L-lactate dehydrogenase-like FMN-dependent dehydrogenase